MNGLLQIKQRELESESQRKARQARLKKETSDALRKCGRKSTYPSEGDFNGKYKRHN
jgi:hypothetical protein